MSTPLADMVEKMLSTGIPPEAIVAAIRAAEQHAQSLVGADPVATKRRVYDRERKRKKAIENPVEKQAEAEGAHIEILTTLPFSLTSDEGSKKDSSSVVTRARPGHRLPADWSLSDDDRDFARTVLPESRITIEFDKFRDHWAASSGRNAVKRDWSAAWRNWCRNSNGGSNGQYRNGGHKSSGGGFGFTEFAAELDRANRP